MLPGGDVGGDAQLDESFSVRFHHRDQPGALVTYCYYATLDLDDLTSIYVEQQTELLVCTDPADPGNTEVWSDYSYAAVQHGLDSVEAATTAARHAAESHLVCDEVWSGRPHWGGRPRREPMMWTAIWTLLAFVLLLFHGDSILAFAAEQLRAHRAHRLDLQRERTKQALIGHDRDALVWRQLAGAADTSDQTPKPS